MPAPGPPPGPFCPSCPWAQPSRSSAATVPPGASRAAVASASVIRKKRPKPADWGRRAGVNIDIDGAPCSSFGHGPANPGVGASRWRPWAGIGAGSFSSRSRFACRTTAELAPVPRRLRWPSSRHAAIAPAGPKAAPRRSLTPTSSRLRRLALCEACNGSTRTKRMQMAYLGRFPATSECITSVFTGGDAMLCPAGCDAQAHEDGPDLRRAEV